MRLYAAQQSLMIVVPGAMYVCIMGKSVSAFRSFTLTKKTAARIPFYSAENPNAVNPFTTVIFTFTKFGLVYFHYFIYTTDSFTVFV